MTSTPPPAPPIQEIGEEEFDDTFKPIEGPDGSDWRERHEIPEGTDVHNVWTVVDGDDRQYILPGHHIVNHVAYVVTAEPWTDDMLTVRVDAFEDEGQYHYDNHLLLKVDDVWIPVTDVCKNCGTTLFQSGADFRWYHEGNHASLCDLSNEEGTHAEPKDV